MATHNIFQRATKSAAKLRMALAGPAGSGKTYTALALATLLADGAPVAVIDTERGSASKYADLFTFDVLELEPPYHPDRYIEALRAAEAAGYAVLVIDSLTHAWQGQGGLLEVHEQVVKRQTTKNSYTAWAEVTPIQARFVDALTGATLHIIATMRSKTEYLQSEGKNGRAEIRKVGMAPIQRDGMEYEFDILGEMDLDNTMIVSKSRCPALSGAVIGKPGAALAETLRAWLAGDELVSAPQATPQAAQQPRTQQPRQQQTGHTWEDVKALSATLHLSTASKTRLHTTHGKDVEAIYAALLAERDRRAALTYNVLGDVRWMARADALGYRVVEQVEEMLAIAGYAVESVTREEAESVLHAEEMKAAAAGLRAGEEATR